jgi:4-hydroxybenzoate polyprenyltransferase
MIKTIKSYLESIKFIHTVFALPFAFMGMILAKRGMPHLDKMFWILIAMIGARSGAMGFNRICDYRFDKENPRTINWPHIKGEITLLQMIVLTVIAYTIFIFAAYQLNSLCFYLSFPVIFILSFYSITKRFTYYTHLFLGFAISLAPVGAWIAITGEFSLKPFLISSVVLFWIAGFDIFYSLQDMEFDKEKGLYSIPVKYGIKRSLQIAKIFHIIMMSALVYMIPVFNLGIVFATGVNIAGIFLIYEHSLVKEDDLSKIDKAFFSVNGWISIMLIVALIIDLLIVS